MNPAKYPGGISPEGAEAITESLDHLLADYQVFHQNVKKLHWNQRLRMHFDLGTQVEELYAQVDGSSDFIAERIMELGYSPKASASQALLYTKLQVVEEVEEYEEAIQMVIQNAQQLLVEIKEVYEIAAQYKDQRTLVMLAELARFLQYSSWLFGAMRLARMN